MLPIILPEAVLSKVVRFTVTTSVDVVLRTNCSVADVPSVTLYTIGSKLMDTTASKCKGYIIIMSVEVTMLKRIIL